MRQIVLVFVMVFGAFIVQPVAPAAAQEENRAGLVIVTGDGTVQQACVSFPEEKLTGYELLQRAGLELSVEAAGTGVTVCAIEGEGCSFPQDACFCRCQGSPCVYWSYWQLEEAGWRYATLGASYVPVQNGDVQGWRWSEGTVTDAAEPPPVSFAELCTDVAPAEVAAAAGADVMTTATNMPLTATVNMVKTVAESNVTTPQLTVGVTEPLPAEEAAPSVQESAQAGQSPAQGITPLLGVTAGVLLAAPIVALGLWALWRRGRRGG